MVRYAPSPTGRLHLGNLRTAWISWLWARHLDAPWVVRFEDIDTPRVKVGSQAEQLADLKFLGLVPDQVVVQSELKSIHFDFFKKAVQAKQVYPCYCSRKEIMTALSHSSAAPHTGETLYSGECRSKNSWPSEPTRVLGWRFKNTDPTGASDFIVARAQSDLTGFIPSYHWACAIDDWVGQYQLLVRAWDLFSATQVQRSIQTWLNQVENEKRPFSAVFHTALLTQDDGARLEKRTRGVTLGELNVTSGEEVLHAFERSFEGVLGFELEKIWGETKTTLTVRELGWVLGSHRV